jgi:hypothetical protein
MSSLPATFRRGSNRRGRILSHATRHSSHDATLVLCHTCAVTWRKPGGLIRLCCTLCGLKGRHIRLLLSILWMPQLDARGQLRREWTTACLKSMRCGCDLSLLWPEAYNGSREPNFQARYSWVANAGGRKAKSAQWCGHQPSTGWSQRDFEHAVVRHPKPPFFLQLMI